MGKSRGEGLINGRPLVPSKGIGTFSSASLVHCLVSRRKMSRILSAVSEQLDLLIFMHHIQSFKITNPG
jgi:hypothetical protein